MRGDEFDLHLFPSLDNGVVVDLDGETLTVGRLPQLFVGIELDISSPQIIIVTI